MGAYGRGDKPCDDGAKHVEFAMCDVDHAHHTEHQRQPQGCERQNGCADRPFEGSKQQVRSEFHDRSLRIWGAGAMAI